jgi:nuclear polyadenylated RNA-binding protein 3
MKACVLTPNPGNLSSDKVSKRDVFVVFYRYGRLAQISLKSAYGFVQYHTAEEARQALEGLQDHEIKGRKIRKPHPAQSLLPLAANPFRHRGFTQQEAAGPGRRSCPSGQTRRQV